MKVSEPHLINCGVVGDLAYHVKKKQKTGEHFSETEIMNWFM